MENQTQSQTQQAQAVIEADRQQRVEHTLAELKKLLDADRTDIVPVMILRPGQYPEAQIQVFAK